MFMNGRRQLLLRDRGPYHHYSDFVRALIDVQIADIHLLETMSSNDPNFNEYLLEDGLAILRVMDELLSRSDDLSAMRKGRVYCLSSSTPRPFAQQHHD